jgi:ribose transport system permease protein
MALRSTTRTVLLLVVLNIMIFAILALLSPTFTTGRNIESLMLRTSELGMLAVGQTLVIITGGLDLSVGAIMALAPVVTSELYAGGVPFSIAVIAGLGSGAAVGLVNAVLIARFRMQPIIVTLATMTIVRSIVYGILRGQTATAFPDPFLDLIDAQILGIPILFLAMLALAGAVAAMLNLMPLGRRIMAVGANQATAHVAGIRVARTLTIVYLLSGTIAALAGLTSTIRVQAATADAGLYAPLEVITAVLIGGTLITGGRGSILGALLGILTLFLLVNGFTLLGVNPFLQQVVMGVILILVIGQDKFRGLILLPQHKRGAPKARGRSP